MKILVSGAGGLVGSVLVPFLRSQGHDVRTLVRHSAGESEEIHWNTETGELDRSKLDVWGDPDAVVHLAGENIAGGRWTASMAR